METWWIHKPPAPRLSVWGALLAWGLLGSATGALVVWIRRQDQSLWPFGQQNVSAAQHLLKYAIVLAAFVAYATVRSVPAWWKSLRSASADRQQLPQLIAAGNWILAARTLHRYSLLWESVWQRVPPEASEWDAQIRPYLTGDRRLYIYYRHGPPALPEDPTSSFAPEVVPLASPKFGAIRGLGLLFILLFFLANGLLNALLVTLLLAGYGTFYFLVLLGRVSYLRLAPGVVQRLLYSPLRRRPKVETFALRDCNVTFDATAARYLLSLMNRSETRCVHTFYLPATGDVATACMRAALSEAPIPPLPDDQLEG